MKLRRRVVGKKGGTVQAQSKSVERKERDRASKMDIEEVKIKAKEGVSNYGNISEEEEKERKAETQRSKGG